MEEKTYRYLHLVRKDCPLPPGASVYGYVRDSGGEDQGASTDQQDAAIREYCEFHHLALRRIFTDERTLSSSTGKRKELRALLAEIEQDFPIIDDLYKREQLSAKRKLGVIFYKPNRFGRDRDMMKHLRSGLRIRGITIIDLVTLANTGNPMADALLEELMQIQDEQYLTEISQNIKRGMVDLVSLRDTDPDFLRYNPEWKSTGAYLGIRPGHPPKGFKAERICIGVNDRKSGQSAGEVHTVQRIVPDPDTWDNCKLAWEMRANNAPLEDIDKVVNLFNTTGGYTTFFSNRIYIGEFEFGGVVYKDFVPAMVSREVFEAVQEKIAQRAPKLRGDAISGNLEPARIGNKSLLSGLVVCGAVDGEEHPMHIETSTARNGTPRAYRYFVCTTAKNSRRERCDAKRVNVRNLEAAVIDALLTHVLTIHTLRPIADKLTKDLSDQHRDVEVQLTSNQERLTETRQAINNLMTAIERMGYAPDLQERYNERKRDEAMLVAEQNQLKALQVHPRRIETITDEMLEDWLVKFRAGLSSGEGYEMRQLLNEVVLKVVVRDGEGMLHCTFPYANSMLRVRIASLEGSTSNTLHTIPFNIPLAASTLSARRNPAKAELRDRITELRDGGMKLKDIATVVNLSFQRVQQILAKQ